LMSALVRFSRKDTSLMLLTQGLGIQPFHNRVVALVNEWTTSAGEMAASFLADNHLGTTIGETTRGAVLGAANFKVGSGYWLRIPIFGWFTPDGRSLEGTGVVPQIPCLIDPEALASGCDTQFEKALQIARTI
jgi:carboxyl-terminal processing protease